MSTCGAARRSLFARMDFYQRIISESPFGEFDD
jgi:hypothetical protein